MDYICNYCTFSSKHSSLLLSHFKLYHENIPGLKIGCFFQNCLQSYSKVKSLEKHIQRNHKHNNKSAEPENESNPEFSHNHNDTLSPNLPDNKIDDMVHGSQFDYFFKFLLNLKENHLVSNKAGEEIIKFFEGVISELYETLRVKTASEFPSGNISDTLKFITSALHNISDVCSQLNTQHKVTKILEKEKKFVAPEEIQLGKTEKYMYVPILPSLQAILSHRDVMSHVINENSISKSSLVSNFQSSDSFQNHPLFAHERSIQLVFYIDDFQTVNPLGNKTKTYKTTGIYYALGNVPPRKRSKLHTIQLAILCQTIYIKKYGLDVIMKRLLHDLKILEKEGVSIKVNTETITLRGSIQYVVADNLASHEICGYNESFSGLRSCRFCTITKEELQKKFECNEFKLRTKESYDDMIRLIESNPSLIPVYGVKKRSVLNDLSYFHVCWGSPSDIAHDIFEGVAPELISVIVGYLVKNKKITLDELNAKIKKFDYSENEKANKPSPLHTATGLKSKIVCKQTAAQCSCLVKLFPFFVAEVIPTNCVYWEVYILFLDFLDFCLAPKLERGDIKVMQTMVQEFVVKFSKLPEIDSIKPKMHFLLHYPQQYIKFGPLIDYTTLRFESKHSYFKNIVARTKNYVNLVKTMATRHQNKQLLYHLSPNFLGDELPCIQGKQTILPANELDAITVDILLKAHQNSFECVTVCPKVAMNDITYTAGSTLMISNEHEITFGLIKNIYYVDGTIYFAVQLLSTEEFDAKCHAFVVALTDDMHAIKLEDLKQCKLPLGIYTTKYLPANHFAIVLPHYIPPDY